MCKSVFFCLQNSTYLYRSVSKNRICDGGIRAAKMMRQYKGFFSLSLVLIFLFPTFVKLEHHHEHVDCHAEHAEHPQEHHENCADCQFHFSYFEASASGITFAKESPTDTYLTIYPNRKCLSVSAYSFLLRAPPAGC